MLNNVKFFRVISKTVYPPPLLVAFNFGAGDHTCNTIKDLHWYVVQVRFFILLPKRINDKIIFTTMMPRAASSPGQQ